ncbi:MAG: YidC/Oxa1 family rane protein insertase [Chloroflexota bacterium]|nr:YidC/Oxa1 family rane protein insertase [Chloroflexota bacterium]MEA2605276.1 YidC/Oxa1 family rane protein insertase [Chloroflexota bacterium]
MTLSRLHSSFVRLLPLLVLVGIALLVAACAGAPTGSGAPGSPAVSPTPQAAIPLKPVALTDPISLLSWLFTPIFQAFFILLVVLDKLTGNIAIAIIGMTIIIRIILIPIFRRQTVSTRRTQMLAPEVKEIQRRFKGDRLKQQEAQRQLYAERGINPASGCLPAILQIFLLIPMYQVFSQGLQNFDPQAMLDIFGFRIIDLGCSAAPFLDPATGHIKPCLDAVAFGVNWGVPEVIIGTTGSMLSGLSLLAVISSLFQLVQSRMTLPAHDPAMADDAQYKLQRQMAYIFPFISLIYGSFLPAGLFLYWITSTIFSIVQQYLIIGWGGMFPLFGWTPGFAHGHAPRFPVTMPPPVDPRTRPATSPLGGSAGRAAQVDKTIRHKERGRQGRRGRRR